MSATDLFRQRFSREPDGIFSAPGRVNLIGEHTDYSGGLVLPFAIDARAQLAAARTADDVVRVVSAQRPGESRSLSLQDIGPAAASAAGWAGYVFGCVWALREAGFQIDGFDLSLDSQVPAGAGLSSSAAVETATVLAVSALSDIDMDTMQIARYAQQAENDFVGVPCGPMDQTASAAAEAGSVLLFDTRSGAVEHIPFDPAGQGLQILVIDTRVAHSLADGEYARRRASTEELTRHLGVQWLRDVAVDDLPGALAPLDSDELRRRLRHVVTENDRVRRTVELLREDRIGDIGPLLTASHASLRDDYEVSCAELDLAVESVLGVGAAGARMTGGGFGGSVIALLRADRVEGASEAVAEAFETAGYASPVCRMVAPAQGARRD